MNEIGKNIRTLREMRGLTQQELAKSSGVAVSALDRLERGDSLSTNKFTDIARALKTRVSDIDPQLRDDLACLERQIESIPKRLKKARLRAGYPTAKLAAIQLGLSYGTYSGHENGLRGIKGIQLAQYALFFKVTPDWLQFGRGPIDGVVREEREQARGDETKAEEIRGGFKFDVGNPTAESEILAAFDGLFDGYGFSTERRSHLAKIFIQALSEPISAPLGRDRAMARRSIARAFVVESRFPRK